jgi:hypothetical protein
VLGCFEELIKMPQTKIESSQVTTLIDMLIKQAESSKSIIVIRNQIESFICYDMGPELFLEFSDFILSSEKSSLNSMARLELAR